MKRNLKWSVLAVAIVAANASVAQAGSGPDINFEWNSTINDEVNNTVNNELNNTVNNEFNTNVDVALNKDVNVDIDYIDSFDRSTTIDDNYSTTVTKDVNVDIDHVDDFQKTTTVTNEYNTNVDYSDSFERSTTVTSSFNAAKDVNVDIDYADSYENTERYLHDEAYTNHQTTVRHDEQVDVDSNIERDEHNVSVSLRKSLSLTSDVNFSGDPTISGDIEVDSAAIAVVDNRQLVSGNRAANEELTNEASLRGDAASGASGNLQFNVGAGDNNVQDNAAALSAADASFAFGVADAEVFVNQQGGGNWTSNVGVTNDAAIAGGAFSGATGNIGVNVASGNNNEQKNALAASVATSAYATASVSSNQISAGNTVSNAPLTREVYETLQIQLSGTVDGTTSSTGTGTYEGSGAAYQMDNFYLDTWSGALPHTNGTTTGHIDMDADIQNAVENPNRPGVGGIAFDTEESGTLAFEEMGTAELEANLSGTVLYSSNTVVAAAYNSASLSGSAFSGASGNIGVNVAAGTGNLQANSLSMAVAQPGAGGGGGGNGGE
jgi:hypothetical protein